MHLVNPINRAAHHRVRGPGACPCHKSCHHTAPPQLHHHGSIGHQPDRTTASEPCSHTHEGVTAAPMAQAALLGTCLLQGGAALAAETAGSTVEQIQFTPQQPGFEIWVGLAAGVIPFLIGSYEFAKRIIIQRRCELCGGRGLVPSTNPNAQYLRKCPQCGGFFPWISWKMFLTSNATPGNGGPLQQPRGQKSVLYEVPAAMPTPEQVQAARAAYMAQGRQAREGSSSAVPDTTTTNTTTTASSTADAAPQSSTQRD